MVNLCSNIGWGHIFQFVMVLQQYFQCITEIFGWLYQNWVWIICKWNVNPSLKMETCPIEKRNKSQTKQTKPCIIELYLRSTQVYQIHFPGLHSLLVSDSGALHTGLWIRVWCGSGIRIQRPFCFHTTLIRIRAALCCTTVLQDSVWDSVQRCTAHSLCAMWSSCKIIIESRSGIRIQWIGFQCLCGEPRKQLDRSC